MVEVQFKKKIVETISFRLDSLGIFLMREIEFNRIAQLMVPRSWQLVAPDLSRLEIELKGWEALHRFEMVVAESPKRGINSDMSAQHVAALIAKKLAIPLVSTEKLLRRKRRLLYVKDLDGQTGIPEAVERIAAEGSCAIVWADC